MDDISIEKRGFCLAVTLNRPQALNALNMGMIEALHYVLDDAEKNSDVFTIVLQGAGDKAFCAGGDIKKARESAIEMRAGRDDQNAVRFFDAEYRLNRKLFHYSKPVIALMNGITMGGGAGLAAPCTYKIAAPKTVWAMPEVTIGFFPDVGAAHFLNVAPGFTGRYLAMTGATIRNAGDLIQCGFATHYSDVSNDTWVKTLSNCEEEKALDETIQSLSKPPPKPDLPYDEVDRYFSKTSAIEILQSLEEGGDWAEDTAKLIRAKSPLSVKIAFHNLEIAKGQIFDEISLRDFHLAQKFLMRGDMVEGIRAVVVDKDHAPRWLHNGIEDVTDQEVAWYFT